MQGAGHGAALSHTQKIKCSKVWLNFARVDADIGCCHSCSGLLMRKHSQCVETLVESTSRSDEEMQFLTVELVAHPRLFKLSVVSSKIWTWVNESKSLLAG